MWLVIRIGRIDYSFLLLNQRIKGLIVSLMTTMSGSEHTEYNLRRRHGSTINMGDSGIHSSTNPLPPIKDRNQDPAPINKDEIENKEMPIIAMGDFEAVDMNEKLNLLMVAINKMNTNFHHKFKELNNEINDPTAGMKAKLESYAANIKEIYESLEDEDEGAFPCIRQLEHDYEGMVDQIDKLESQLANVTDQLTMIRGTIVVHDK